VLLLDEFLAREADRGQIGPDAFTDEARSVKLHGHCQQKAIASNLPTVRSLSLPRNFRVSVIPSGCCGMAGSFGYESEHYDLAMKVGELILLPAVREAVPGTIIAAPGTSCRHQIKDGTGQTALHTAEILCDALVHP
jgi:Fe-S oxidoreductase